MADKKGATPDDIMSAAAMKPVLAKAKEGPINCAIGLTDAKDGVALLHAKTKPKKLLAEMKKLAKDHSLKLDAGSLRFGTGQLDPDDNTLLRITVNKGPVGGMEAKLRVQMRNSGCAKVEFLVDASLEEEPEDDVAPADAPAAAAAAPEPPPPPPPPPTAPAPDAATLTATLAQLMQQIAKVAGADKTLQQSLVKIAAAANGALKGGDLAGAAASIRDLRGALAAAADTAKLNAQADGAPSAVTYAKSRLAWLAARNKVASEIDKLRTQIVATYQENGIAADLEKAYQTRVAPVLTTLDESLADKLDEATNATDAAKRGELVTEARAIMDKYAQYLAGEPLIADLDDNPFVPLAIRATIGGTLNALSKAVH